MCKFTFPHFAKKLLNQGWFSQRTFHLAAKNLWWENRCWKVKRYSSLIGGCIDKYSYYMCIATGRVGKGDHNPLVIFGTHLVKDQDALIEQSVTLIKHK